MANYIGIAIGFLTTFFVLTRCLTEEEVGLTRMMVDAATLFSSLAMLGTNSTLVRYFPWFKDDGGNHGIFAWSVLVPAVGLTVMTVLFFVFRQPLTELYAPGSPLAAQYFYMLPMLIVNKNEMFTIPILMASFGGASVMSLVSGVLLVPISEIALILSLLTAVLSYVPLLSAAFAFLARIPLAFLLFLTGKISDVDGAYISLGQPFTPYIIAAGALLTLIVIFVKKLDKRLVLAVGTFCVAAFIFCNAIFSSLNFKNTDVVYSVDKSNESFVIVSQGNTFVVDVSNGGYATFENAVYNVNLAYHEEIDYIVLTHLHSNHINGLLKTASSIKVKNILLPTAENESDAMVIRSITHALEDKVNIIYYNRLHHSEVEIGNVTMTLPEYVTLKRSTHPVISFCIEENGHRIGYIGASALDSENANINNIYLNSDCLIIGAHGPVIKEELQLDCCVSENIIVGSSAEEQIRIEGYGGNVIYPSDSGGRVHIRFENK